MPPPCTPLASWLPTPHARMYPPAPSTNNRKNKNNNNNKTGKETLAASIQKTKDVLGLPKDYHVAVVAGSDTGAYELAMWNFLGARPVDVLHWESFGSGWFKDAAELGLDQVRGVAPFLQILLVLLGPFCEGEQNYHDRRCGCCACGCCAGVGGAAGAGAAAAAAAAVAQYAAAAESACICCLRRCTT